MRGRNIDEWNEVVKSKSQNVLIASILHVLCVRCVLMCVYALWRIRFKQRVHSREVQLALCSLLYANCTPYALCSLCSSGSTCYMCYTCSTYATCCMYWSCSICCTWCMRIARCMRCFSHQQHTHVLKHGYQSPPVENVYSACKTFLTHEAL